MRGYTVRLYAPASVMSRTHTTALEVPAQLSRFVGREKEIGEVRGLLATTRLLTITGTGGSGKTRLAIETAARSGRETAWVDLAPITNPRLLASQVAAALGVRQRGAQPPLTSIVDALRDRSILVVLDNCEHLLEAVAPLVDALLRGCPDLRVLATSREALALTGEVAWPLPTLSLPDEGAANAREVAASEAVELFVARARDALPSFVLDDASAPAVARICRHLDGLPLALELAAARVRVLAPEQIADRLNDRFRLLRTASRMTVPRHRTLEEVIGWSYQLLTPEEQTVLQRLSVFARDLSLAGAEAVCVSGEVGREAVLDLVEALVARSLLVVEAGPRQARYRMLETIRHYARDRLRESGAEVAARRAHASFFLAGVLAAEADAFAGGRRPGDLEWFDTEIEEIRLAAAWLEHDGESAEPGLRLAAALEWFWFVRGRFGEGRRWLDSALGRAGDASPLARGRALAASAVLAFSQGDVAAQRSAAEAAVAQLEGAGDPAKLAHALSILGNAMVLEGEVDPAVATLERAVALARDPESPELVTILALQGSTRALSGDVEGARTAWSEGAALARVRGFGHSEVHLEEALGRVAFADGELEEARAHFERVTEIQVNDPWCRALAMQGHACLSLMDGDHHRAATLLAAAAALRARIAAPPRPDEVAFLDALRSTCRHEIGDVRFRETWREGTVMTPEQALSARTDGTPQRWARADGCDLAVRSLGPLLIHVDGRPVNSNLARHPQVRELLVHLLWHPGGRTREQIGLVFWPEATTAQVKNRFHVLLHKLRKSLGRPELVMSEGERYRVTGERLYFDAVEFEREMEGVLRERSSRQDTSEKLKAALSMYEGDFLHGEPAGSWHLDVQDRLRRLFLDGLGALAEDQMETDDVGGARETLERLVTEEPLSESAHRGLMVCLAREGRRDRALERYARLRQILLAELEVEPDAETRRLADRIRTGDAV